MTDAASAAVTAANPAPRTPTKQYDVEGLKAQVCGGRLLVVLPSITSESDCPRVFHLLQRLCVVSEPDLDWDLDLTALETLPLPLICLIASLTEVFRDQGRSLTLTGARPELLPPPDYASHPFAPEQPYHRHYPRQQRFA